MSMVTNLGSLRVGNVFKFIGGDGERTVPVCNCLYKLKVKGGMSTNIKPCNKNCHDYVGREWNWGKFTKVQPVVMVNALERVEKGEDVKHS
jgi:hypothetical protein